MMDRGAVSITQLATRVPGLDDVLGGGLPELSFNLIVGGPGCGKTTLAHQIMFANATAERPGLAFLTDALILQRYVELDGALKRVRTVVKVRGSDHSTNLRFYDVNATGITVGESIREYHHGLLTADPRSSVESRLRGPSRRDRRQRS